MPSLIHNYEYDIFISYRHNDNRSGWVTEFVKNLQEELSATIKEPVSVYFDSNPHDGLLETHNVDKSLEGKLKCLIFIPIISQTYCDPKSFAWQHEFVPFNNLAKEDGYGRDIKISNGNVASRILPIKIHDLDAEDKTLLENELKGVLRSIEFIYKSAGVNRPLTPFDNPDKNVNKTFYRDQINKTANAIKELIAAVKNSSAVQEVRSSPQKSIAVPASPGKPKILIYSIAFIALIIAGYFSWDYFKSRASSGELSIDKSIAVLPFDDMSPGKDQEYLGDGIAEEIITALSGIKDLKVIGRTSSFQFKGKAADLRDIGEKLQVATVLEGSIQKSGDNVRVTAQLIKVDDGSHIWSQRYDRKMTDIFAIQDEISAHITEKLKLTLLEKRGKDETDEIVPTTNMEAYEMVLKGNFFIRQGPSGAQKALGFFEKAVALDSSYVDAYFGIAYSYFFAGDPAKMSEVVERLRFVKAKEQSVHDLLLIINLWREWNWLEARKLYESAVALNFPVTITRAYYEAVINRDLKQGIRTLNELVKNDPLYLDALRNLATFYLFDKQFMKAGYIIDKMLEIDPLYKEARALKASAYLRQGEFNLALESCMESEEKTGDKEYFETLKIRILAESGQLREANKLFEVQKNNTPDNSRFPWRLVEIYFSLGREKEAYKWLNKVCEQKLGFMIYVTFDPRYDRYRDDPRFKDIMKKMKLPE